MRNRQKGFTLIELMIVVAIIGIIAGLALPAYGDYTARAQAAEAFTLMDGLKTPLAEVYTVNSTWAIAGSAVKSGKYVNIIEVAASGGTSIIATFKPTDSGTSNKIAGKNVHLYYAPAAGTWVCADGDAANDTEANGGAAGANGVGRDVLPKACK